MKEFNTAFGNDYICAFDVVRAPSFRQACRAALAQVRRYGKYTRKDAAEHVEYVFACGPSLIVRKEARNGR